MQVLENLKIKEKLYTEKLDNGLTVMIVPKKGIRKKYIIWGTHYGSNDSKFIVPGETDVTEVPKGVAHFLEHKMFEQENGRNSLDVLSSLGVNANAYTTNTHTAYLYECTENFYEAYQQWKSKEIDVRSAAALCGMSKSTFHYKAKVYDRKMY